MQEESRLIDSTPAAKRRRLLFSAAAAFLLPSSALAQAWLAPGGEASFGVAYQNLYTRDHLSPEGEPYDAGRIRMNLAVIGLAYSFTDRLAASASVPYVSARYDGTLPHVYPGYELIDDGTDHDSFTDLRLDLRYNLWREPAMVTPFVSAIIPIRDYWTFAHSSLGSGLKQYLVGVSAGRRLDPILETGYVQLRYSYAFVEKVLGVSHDRSNLDLEIGYFPTPSLGVSALGSYQKTYGGIDIPLPGTPEATVFRRSRYFVHHDQIARSDILNLGGVVSYALTGTVDVFASYQATAWGRNIHAIQPGLAFGMSWGFSPKRVIRSFVRRSATGEPSTE